MPTSVAAIERSKSSGCEKSQAKSKLLSRERASSPGRSPMLTAQARNTLAANMSKKLRTSVLETTVV